MIPTILLDSHQPPANLAYLFAAFAVAWLLFFGYMFFVTRRQQEMRQDIERLRREVVEEPAAQPSPRPEGEGTGGD